jgi:hypothetical protein
MPDFVHCPQCGLKHSRRDDGLCPRCQNAVAVDALPAVEQGGATAPERTPVIQQLQVREPDAPGVVTAGSRAAGIVLLLNAAVNVASVALVSADAGVNPVHGIVADLALGIGLLSGRAKWQKWAYVRALVGGVIFGGIFAAQGNWFAVAFQLLLSGSLVLLLYGNPGKLRLGSAFALCAPYFALAALGVVTTEGGSNPVSATVLSAKGEIQPAAGTLQGARFGYCLDVPASNWYLRTEAAAHRDNPLSDRWLTRPDLDAHVMIIGDEVQSGTISQARYEEALTGDARAHLTEFRFVGKEPLRGGAALHYTGRAQQMNLEYFRGAFADGSRAYQVVAFATPEHFAKAHDELSGMLRSFRADCHATAETEK